MLDPAGVQDGDPISHLHRFGLVVGDEYGREAGSVMNVEQPFAQVLADLGVQGPEWLVEKQDARFDGERPGERDSLALAAR